MAFDTFVSPANVYFSQGTSEARQPKVLTAEFGDGYVQRAGDGLNADAGEVKVSWAGLRPSEANPIFDFFKSKKGYIPFKFKMPGEATARKWIATAYTRSWVSEVEMEITATWKEVFDPE